MLFRAIFDIADVAELDCVRPAIGYDQVIELRRIGNPSHRAHGQLALTCFDAPARQFHVLKLDRTGHVSRRDIEGAHFVGIDPDFDLTFASADDFHVADAIDRFDHALDLFVGQVGYFAQGSRRGHRNAQYRRGIGVELLNNWDFGCFWKIVDDKIDFVAHFLGRHVRVLLKHEGNKDLRDAFERGRTQLVNTADRVDGAFYLVGNFSLDFFRRSTRIDDRNSDRRQIDLWKQVDSERSK